MVATASAWEAHYGGKSVGLIHWVGTDPKYRGHGLGYAISLRALKELVARGYTDAYLNTALWREPAVRLYKRLGFRITPTGRLSGQFKITKDTKVKARETVRLKIQENIRAPQIKPLLNKRSGVRYE